MPDDTKLERVSRTIRKDQVVDELILKFTQDRQIDFLLPGIPPSGKYVELPHVVVMEFNGLIADLRLPEKHGLRSCGELGGG